MAGRRTSLASLAGQKVDAVPGLSDPLLLTLPLSVLVPTRFNPRRNFGTDDDLKAFGLILKRRQLQPAVVVSRSAYLKLWPEEAERVGQAQYVIANGERRYRGSKAAGLTTLNVVHHEDVAKTRADFLDAVLSENNDREDLDPIERALGIETMVAELGGADKVAAHYEKSKGWVSQQRKLLKLTPELQDLVSAGELPIRVARDIAGLPASNQAAAWAAEQKARVEGKASKRTASPARAVEKVPAEPSRFTAVNQTPPGETAEQVAASPERAHAEQVASPLPPASPDDTDRVAAQFRSAEVPDPRPAPPDIVDASAAKRAEEPARTQRWSLPDMTWEELAELIVNGISEYDRHMLTVHLHRRMKAELDNPVES
ncbi:ParB/RepB/Spo0J family partition protein [Streptomyces sp. NPDC059783]|uniref:ParB/RepB/Spo0J family partition protein n=1 Tax=Streptomyces sp. NPDC059783 TaxID=3346944 RepID=UPI0036474C5C